MTVGDTVTELGVLTAMEVIGFRIKRDHIVLLNHQKQGSQITVMDNRVALSGRMVIFQKAMDIDRINRAWRS